MLTYVSGDPLLTQAQTLAFGWNARGQNETDPLGTMLQYRFPAAFATYHKRCRDGRLKPGQIWLWHESQPALAFLVVRETAVGMTRLRYVDNVALTLARDYRLLGLTTLALAPLGTADEAPAIREALTTWLNRSPLPVIAYDRYLPNIAAELS